MGRFGCLNRAVCQSPPKARLHTHLGGFCLGSGSPPSCGLHTQSLSVPCVSGWGPAEAERRRGSSRPLCSSAEVVVHLGWTLRGSTGEGWVGGEGAPPTDRAMMGQKPRAPPALPLPMSWLLGRLWIGGLWGGLKASFLQDDWRFFPALKGDNPPGNRSIRMVFLE